MSPETFPACASIAAFTTACGSTARYFSRSRSSTHEARGSPSWSGTAVPPAPTTTPANSPGWSAAANRAAGVPTSGATMNGRPSPVSSTSRARNPPMARGASRSSRPSDPPNPGRSTAKSRACALRVSQMGVNAYRLSGHGLVSRIVGPAVPPPSAHLTHTPSTVRTRTSGSGVVSMGPLSPRLVGGRQWQSGGGPARRLATHTSPSAVCPLETGERTRVTHGCDGAAPAPVFLLSAQPARRNPRWAPPRNRPAT